MTCGCSDDRLCPAHTLAAQHALRSQQPHHLPTTQPPTRKPPAARMTQLKDRRLEAGWAISDVANTMQPKRGRTTLQQWEAGVCRPTDGWMDAYEKALTELGAREPRLPRNLRGGTASHG